MKVFLLHIQFPSACFKQCHWLWHKVRNKALTDKTKDISVFSCKYLQNINLSPEILEEKHNLHPPHAEKRGWISSPQLSFLQRWKKTHKIQMAKKSLTHRVSDQVTGTQLGRIKGLRAERGEAGGGALRNVAWERTWGQVALKGTDSLHSRGAQQGLRWSERLNNKVEQMQEQL